MNKEQLVKQIATQANLNQKQASDALSAVCSSITEALSANDNVQLIGFGSFSISERNARTGRNPQTGAAITIPAKKIVKFKASKKVDEEVNG